MSLSSAFVPTIPVSRRTSFLSSLQQRRVTTTNAHLRERRTARMMMPQLSQLTDIAIILALKADIGPFTNVDVETVGLLGAIAGGSLVAAVITLTISRF